MTTTLLQELQSRLPQAQTQIEKVVFETSMWLINENVKSWYQ